jgi:hypothetical protein
MKDPSTTPAASWRRSQVVTARAQLRHPSVSLCLENCVAPDLALTYAGKVHAHCEPTPERRYDKGERRYKHVGRGEAPEIEFVQGNPRMWIGKCPATLSADDQVRLVNEAIPGSNGDRELQFAKKLYAVHGGAIYEGQTTDQGKSYHGYPYRGKLARGLIDALRDIAVKIGCENEFDTWVKRHIEVHGT